MEYSSVSTASELPAQNEQYMYNSKPSSVPTWQKSELSESMTRRNDKISDAPKCSVSLSCTNYSFTVARPSVGFSLKNKTVSAIISEPFQSLNLSVHEGQWPFIHHNFQVLHPREVKETHSMSFKELREMGVPLPVLKISILVRDANDISSVPSLFAEVFFPCLLLYTQSTSGSERDKGVAKGSKYKKEFVVALEPSQEGSASFLDASNPYEKSCDYESIVNRFNDSIRKAVGNNRVGKLFLIFTRSDSKTSIPGTCSPGLLYLNRPTVGGITGIVSSKDQTHLERFSSPVFVAPKFPFGRGLYTNCSDNFEIQNHVVPNVTAKDVSLIINAKSKQSEVRDFDRPELKTKVNDKSEREQNLEEEIKSLKNELQLQKQLMKKSHDEYEQSRRALEDELLSYKTAVSLFGGLSALHSSFSELSKLRQEQKQEQTKSCIDEKNESGRMPLTELLKKQSDEIECLRLAMSGLQGKIMAMSLKSGNPIEKSNADENVLVSSQYRRSLRDEHSADSLVRSTSKNDCLTKLDFSVNEIEASHVSNPPPRHSVQSFTSQRISATSPFICVSGGIMQDPLFRPNGVPQNNGCFLTPLITRPSATNVYQQWLAPQGARPTTRENTYPPHSFNDKAI